MRTYEQIQEYQRAYREKHKDSLGRYHVEYNELKKKRRLKAKYQLCKSLIPKKHRDTDAVIKSLPMPFGSLKKAKYLLCRKYKINPIYFFTTTCRNTEDCVESMKQKAIELNVQSYFFVYKIQDGEKYLIYKEC